MTEARAIALALAQEGIAARDDADRAAAAAEVDVIGPLDNPELDVVREGGGQTEWQLSVVQPIDLTGRRAALRDAARADADAAASEIERRRQVLVADVRGAYVRCAAASAQAAVWKTYTADVAEALRIASARAEAGDTAVYDVRRVRVEASAAEAGRLQAEGEQGAGCAALAGLTGIADPAVAIEAITTLSHAETAAGERADLTAQEQRIAAAEYRLSAAERARLPQLSVGAGVRAQETGTGTQYGPIISVGVSLPLWNGGGAAVRREDAMRTSLEAELAIARRRIAAEQSAASARLSSSQAAAVAAISARDDAGRLGTIANTAYQSGEIGVVELLDAYEAARDADLSVIAFALNAALAAIDYDLTTGRSY
ncbi:MAG: TolC family protein [Sphingomonas sp.]|uniref:TolC family protein n=1 Tax=Sphingomonas sp. TaxID=28214 RepID=UPI0017AAF4A4|nr:TolC family protein [Sphingomonas sp.]